ncbi:hypothetical protein HK104_000917 [Borealophlyctis nickersoniae]|nr:hypothetical protein HK104_000917 [Borealophlyctis nickersoniae]
MPTYSPQDLDKLALKPPTEAPQDLGQNLPSFLIGAMSLNSPTEPLAPAPRKSNAFSSVFDEPFMPNDIRSFVPITPRNSPARESKTLNDMNAGIMLMTPSPIRPVLIRQPSEGTPSIARSMKTPPITPQRFSTSAPPQSDNHLLQFLSYVNAPSDSRFDTRTPPFASRSLDDRSKYETPYSATFTSPAVNSPTSSSTGDAHAKVMGFNPTRNIVLENVPEHVSLSQIQSVFEEHGPIRHAFRSTRLPTISVVIMFFDICHAYIAFRSVQIGQIRMSFADTTIMKAFIVRDGSMADDVLIKCLENQGEVIVEGWRGEEGVLLENFKMFGNIRGIREIDTPKGHVLEYYDTRAAERAHVSMYEGELQGCRLRVRLYDSQAATWDAVSYLRTSFLMKQPFQRANSPLGRSQITAQDTDYFNFRKSFTPSPQRSASFESGFDRRQASTPRSRLLPVSDPSAMDVDQTNHTFYSEHKDDHMHVEYQTPSPLGHRRQLSRGQILAAHLRIDTASFSSPSGTVGESSHTGDNNLHRQVTSQNGQSSPFEIHSAPISRPSFGFSPFAPEIRYAALNEDKENIDPAHKKEPARLAPALGTRGGGDTADAEPPVPLPGSLSRNLSSPANELNIYDIVMGKDKRTTFMIRNIPNKYTQQMLLDFINETHKGEYDFFYLRMDFKNRCNVGYAFINFTGPSAIVSFAERAVGKRWSKFNSDKVCTLSYANIQGKQALIDKFRNSSVMLEHPTYRPKVFSTSGPTRGEEEPFPPPTNRVRPRSDVLFSRDNAWSHLRSPSAASSASPTPSSTVPDSDNMEEESVASGGTGDIKEKGGSGGGH